MTRQTQHHSRNGTTNIQGVAKSLKGLIGQSQLLIGQLPVSDDPLIETIRTRQLAIFEVMLGQIKDITPQLKRIEGALRDE